MRMGCRSVLEMTKIPWRMQHVSSSEGHKNNYLFADLGDFGKFVNNCQIERF